MRCGRRRRGGGGGDAPTHPPPVSLLPGADCGTQHYKYLSLSEARAYKDRHEPRLVLVRAVKGSGAEFDGGESDGDDDDDDDVTAAKGSSGSPASPPLPRLVHRPHPLLATHTGYHPFCARRPRRSDLAKYGPGVVLYFKLLKYGAVWFALMSLVCGLPLLGLYAIGDYTAQTSTTASTQATGSLVASLATVSVGNLNGPTTLCVSGYEALDGHLNLTCPTGMTMLRLEAFFGDLRGSCGCPREQAPVPRCRGLPSGSGCIPANASCQLTERRPVSLPSGTVFFAGPCCSAQLSGGHGDFSALNFAINPSGCTGDQLTVTSAAQGLCLGRRDCLLPASRYANLSWSPSLAYGTRCPHATGRLEPGVNCTAQWRQPPPWVPGRTNPALEACGGPPGSLVPVAPIASASYRDFGARLVVVAKCYADRIPLIKAAVPESVAAPAGAVARHVPPVPAQDVSLAATGLVLLGVAVLAAGYVVLTLREAQSVQYDRAEVTAADYSIVVTGLPHGNDDDDDDDGGGSEVASLPALEAALRAHFEALVAATPPVSRPDLARIAVADVNFALAGSPLMRLYTKRGRILRRIERLTKKALVAAYEMLHSQPPATAAADGGIARPAVTSRAALIRSGSSAAATSTGSDAAGNVGARSNPLSPQRSGRTSSASPSPAPRAASAGRGAGKAAAHKPARRHPKAADGDKEAAYRYALEDIDAARAELAGLDARIDEAEAALQGTGRDRQVQSGAGSTGAGKEGSGVVSLSPLASIAAVSPGTSGSSFAASSRRVSCCSGSEKDAVAADDGDDSRDGAAARTSRGGASARSVADPTAMPPSKQPHHHGSRGDLAHAVRTTLRQWFCRPRRPRAVAAFITFEEEEGALRALAAYAGHNPRWWQGGACRWHSPAATPSPLLLDGTHAITVKRAPSPTDIQFNHYDIPPAAVCGRRALPLALVLLFLLSASYCKFALANVVATNQRAFTTTACSTLGGSVSNKGAAIEDAYWTYFPNMTTGETGRLACYCKWLLSTSGPAALTAEQFTVPPANESVPLCAEWLASFLATEGAVVGESLVIVAHNLLLSPVLRFAVQWGGYRTHSAERRARAFYLFGYKYVLSALLLLLLHAYINTGNELLAQGSFTDMIPSWYTQVGASLQLIVLLDIATGHLSVAFLVGFRMLLRWRDRGWARKDATRTRKRTQQELNDLHLNNAFNVDSRYAHIYSTLFAALTFSAGMPLLIPALAAVFATTYVFDKVFFLRYHATPPHYDGRLGRSFTALLPLAVVIHVAFAVWILSTPAILPPLTGVAAAVREATDTAPTDSTIASLQSGLGGGGFVEVGARVTNYATIPLVFVLVLLLGALAVWYVLWPLAVAAAHAIDARFPAACARCPAVLRPRPPRPPRARGLPPYFDAVPPDVLDDVVTAAGEPPGAYSSVKPELAARLARTRAAAAARRSLPRSVRLSAPGRPLALGALHALVGRFEALTAALGALRELQREAERAAAAFVDDVRAATAAAAAAAVPDEPQMSPRALLARRLAAMGGGPDPERDDGSSQPTADDGADDGAASDGELAPYPVARLRSPATLADVRALRLRALAALALPAAAAAAFSVADAKAYAATVTACVEAVAARVAAECEAVEARVTDALARQEHGDGGNADGGDDDVDAEGGGVEGQPPSPLRASLRVRMPLLTTLPSRKRALAPATPVLAPGGDVEAGSSPPSPTRTPTASWLARLLRRAQPPRSPTDSTRTVASAGTAGSGVDGDLDGDLAMMADQQWCYDVHEQRRFAARFGLSAGVASSLKRRMASPAAAATSVSGDTRAAAADLPKPRHPTAAASSAGGGAGNDALTAVLPSEAAAAAGGSYAAIAPVSRWGSRPPSSRGFGASLKAVAAAAGAAATGALAATDLA